MDRTELMDFIAFKKKPRILFGRNSSPMITGPGG